jgi:hypothetical protein
MGANIFALSSVFIKVGNREENLFAAAAGGETRST